MKIKKLTILGDSILKCVIYDKESNRYKSTGEERFKKLTDELGIEVNNLSSLGLTAKKAYERKMHLMSNDCDFMIIGLGGNDCDYNWKEISETPDLIHDNNTPPADYKIIMTNMITELLTAGVNVGLMTLPPICSDKYFKKISTGLNADNILKWIKDVNQIYRTQEFYSNIVRDLAAEFNLPLIDARGQFLVFPDNHKLIGADGIHMNTLGYEHLVGIITRYLKAKFN